MLQTGLQVVAVQQRSQDDQDLPRATNKQVDPSTDGVEAPRRRYMIVNGTSSGGWKTGLQHPGA